MDPKAGHVFRHERARVLQGIFSAGGTAGHVRTALYLMDPNLVDAAGEEASTVRKASWVFGGLLAISVGAVSLKPLFANPPPPSVESLIPAGMHLTTVAPAIRRSAAVHIALDYIKTQQRFFAQQGVTMTARVHTVQYRWWATPSALVPKGGAPVWIVTIHGVPNYCSHNPASPFAAVGILINAATGKVIEEWMVACRRGGIG